MFWNFSFVNLDLQQFYAFITKHYFRFSKLSNDFFRIYPKTTQYSF